MRISFHGAAQTVTGSKHLLQLKNGINILLDCGMFQGMGKQTIDMNMHWGFDPADIGYLILSHAHIDHSGLIPKLYKDGFRGPIYCTPATKKLAAILLEDSAEIQRDDTRFTNKKRAKQGLPPFEPMYSVDDALAAVGLFVSVEYGEWFQVCDGVEAMFTDAGHIIGSASVNLKVKEDGKITALTFSGDIGRYRDDILRSPEVFPQADYIIMESTYGNSLHDEVHHSVDTFLKWIEHTCLQKKGKLIIPAFSVGRTQTLLLLLNQLELERRLPKINIYVDSPLSKEATAVIKSYPQYFNKRLQKVMQSDADPFDFTGLHFIENAEESKRLNELKDPCVIISASGMADAGRIKHHIMNNIDNPNNTILMVGYCEPRSLGGKLMAGVKDVRIFGEDFKVKAEVGSMRSMSAHGDYDDLLQWLSCQNKQQVKQLFLVHGEPDVMADFSQRLQRKGFEVVMPEMHQGFGL
ncbi:MAG: MBL fold metallo-hydrolase [Chitinophagales bacterium]|nr:MBL fold metallo-hydrolase [Chitinophagales bacterium]